MTYRLVPWPCINLLTTHHFVASLFHNLTHAPTPPPRYQDYQAADIPVVEDSSTRSRVRVMAGSHAGVRGPISMVNPGLLMDVVLQPGGSVRLEVPQDWTSFAYVYDGVWQYVCGGG